MAQAEIGNPYRGFCRRFASSTSQLPLWHQEDIARSPDAATADRRGQAGHRQLQPAAERRDRALDDYLFPSWPAKIVPAPDARQNTETPGSAIDRLSILALRLYHMEEQADRTTPAKNIAPRPPPAEDPARAASRSARSLGELLDDIFAGRKRLKVYLQFKMYNDPTMNPYLYQGQGGKS